MTVVCNSTFPQYFRAILLRGAFQWVRTFIGAILLGGAFQWVRTFIGAILLGGAFQWVRTFIGRLPAQQATDGGVTSHLSMSVPAPQNTTRKLRWKS